MNGGSELLPACVKPVVYRVHRRKNDVYDSVCSIDRASTYSSEKKKENAGRIGQR